MSLAMFGKSPFNQALFNDLRQTVVTVTPGFNRGFNKGLSMLFIKLNESTASRRNVPFDMISSSTLLPVSGLTFSGSEIQVYKNDGTNTAFAGTVSEIGGGSYIYQSTQTEAGELGPLIVTVNKSGVQIYKALAQVVAFDPYDATRYGLSSLPDADANAAGGLITSGSGTGQLTVDGSGGGHIALGQAVPASDLTSKTTQDVGDCLSAARAEGAGKWVFAGTVETIYGPDGVQVVRTFTLNHAVNPTQRT